MVLLSKKERNLFTISFCENYESLLFDQPYFIFLVGYLLYEGYEADVVFLIIDEGNKHEELDDNPEMIYAGITRSKSDIMVFTNKDSRYNEFFYKELEAKTEAYI
ncbi:MAG: Unknown protein [uncultured Sulfurovum sp.]|uniref:UvrD-like helicase C-terminal domain-containing protein n=1 Tax=uncultured Sulfurovum sp. TaxID=269237 RepID=A0A6S6T8P9_9BACT|nr:MAG: Unknown protein [uncultured Sulfurovum sp.]